MNGVPFQNVRYYFTCYLIVRIVNEFNVKKSNNGRFRRISAQRLNRLNLAWTGIFRNRFNLLFLCWTVIRTLTDFRYFPFEQQKISCIFLIFYQNANYCWVVNPFLGGLAVEVEGECEDCEGYEVFHDGDGMKVNNFLRWKHYF